MERHNICQTTDRGTLCIPVWYTSGKVNQEVIIILTRPTWIWEMNLPYYPNGIFMTAIRDSTFLYDRRNLNEIYIGSANGNFTRFNNSMIKD